MRSNLKTRSTRTGLAAALVLAALAGCTLGPDYKRPDLTLAPAWRGDLADAADLANSEWWRAFGDPELDQLIESTLASNLDLKLAALRIEEYDARLQVSQAAKYPQVGYAAGGGRELRSQERPNGLQPGVSPYVNNVETSGSLSWELDLWGKVRRSNEAALANLLATQETRRGVMLTIVANVATGYVQLLELDQQLALGHKSLKNRENALALVQQKFEGGSATRMAVEQARAELEATAAEIPPVERDIAALENMLSGLQGVSAGPIRRRQLDALAMPQLPLGLPADVLTRRPDVMAAEQDLVAANALIGVAKTGWFPTLSLTAAIGLAADNPKWLWAETARTGSLGAGLTGPLFNGGSIEGDIRQAEAVQKQKLVIFQQTVQTALKEVDDALLARTKSGQREASLGRQVGALKEVSQLTQQRYEGGQSTFVDVLDADRKLLSAQGVQAQGRRDSLLALIEVYKAMGGGWMVEQDNRRAQALAANEAKAEK